MHGTLNSNPDINENTKDKIPLIKLNPNTVNRVNEPPVYTPRSDQELAEQFYTKLEKIEQKVNNLDGCCAKTVPYTCGPIIDCSPVGTSIGLLAVGKPDIVVAAGGAIGCLYAILFFGSFYEARAAECREKTGFPFAFTKACNEQRKQSVNDASSSSTWEIDPDVLLLLTRWKADISAQNTSNTGTINFEQLSNNQHDVYSVEKIAATRELIANTYQSKFKKDIKTAIASRSSENTPLFMK